MPDATDDANVPVWIVEDDPDYRAALTLLVGQAGGLDVAGAFDSAEAALEAAGRGGPPPGLVLMDVNLPGLRGTEAIGGIRSRFPDARVVMLTVRDDPDTVFEALKAGASGYLLKGTPLGTLLAALREALDGGVLMPAPVARRVLGFFHEDQPGSRAPSDAYGLSARERDVLRLMAEGLTQKEIADALFISASTVNGHIQRVYEKLHVHTAPAAVAKALRERLL